MGESGGGWASFSDGEGVVLGFYWLVVNLLGANMHFGGWQQGLLFTLGELGWLVGEAFYGGEFGFVS